MKNEQSKNEVGSLEKKKRNEEKEKAKLTKKRTFISEVEYFQTV